MYSASFVLLTLLMAPRVLAFGRPICISESANFACHVTYTDLPIATTTLIPPYASDVPPAASMMSHASERTDAASTTDSLDTPVAFPMSLLSDTSTNAASFTTASLEVPAASLMSVPGSTSGYSSTSSSSSTSDTPTTAASSTAFSPILTRPTLCPPPCSGYGPRPGNTLRQGAIIIGSIFGATIGVLLVFFSAWWCHKRSLESKRKADLERDAIWLTRPRPRTQLLALPVPPLSHHGQTINVTAEYLARRLSGRTAAHQSDWNTASGSNMGGDVTSRNAFDTASGHFHQAIGVRTQASTTPLLAQSQEIVEGRVGLVMGGHRGEGTTGTELSGS